MNLINAHELLGRQADPYRYGERLRNDDESAFLHRTTSYELQKNILHTKYTD
jgi:hypothetical protein